MRETTPPRRELSADRQDRPPLSWEFEDRLNGVLLVEELRLCCALVTGALLPRHAIAHWGDPDVDLRGMLPPLGACVAGSSGRLQS
eukprot:scaffold65690_cov29-Tisochrysis_lutea.AAC.1